MAAMTSLNRTVHRIVFAAIATIVGLSFWRNRNYLMNSNGWLEKVALSSSIILPRNDSNIDDNFDNHLDLDRYAEIVSFHRHSNHQQHQRQANRQKRLEFVHIPKTGGTAIESAAARVNVSWSVCHFLGPHISQKISRNLTSCPNAPSTKYKKPKVIYGVPHWHLPPSYFAMKDRYTYNPYENATLFCVVRNPYERLVSLYFYRRGEILKNSVEQMNNVDGLNEWVHLYLARLHQIEQRGDTIDPSQEATEQLGEKNYYMFNGHLIPQFDFVYNGGGETRNIQHVLHFETLAYEFPQLMQEYGLSHIRLPPRHEHKGRSSSGYQRIGVANLTLPNIRLIESYYGKDFAAFGYPTLSSRIENRYRYQEPGEEY